MAHALLLIGVRWTTFDRHTQGAHGVETLFNCFNEEYCAHCKEPIGFSQHDHEVPFRSKHSSQNEKLIHYGENFKIIFPLVLALSVFTSCSSTRLVEPIGNADAATPDQSYSHQKSSFYTRFSFEKGSANLTDETRSALSELVNQSEAQGKIEEIKVLSWADEDANSGKRIPAKQKALADQRNRKIKLFMKEFYPSVSVHVYNMAQTKNSVHELYKTADAKTKKSFEDAGLMTNEAVTNPPANASEGLVLSILKK